MKCENLVIKTRRLASHKNIALRSKYSYANRVCKGGLYGM
jgi:hypothetical protein